METSDKPIPTRLPGKILHIEVSHKEDRLQISVSERRKGEEVTIRNYEETFVSMDLVKSRCRELVNTLNKANRMGRMSPDVLARLREIGQIFHDELFTLNVKEKLNVSRAQYMCLNLDEQLVQIPWELLHNGQQFLCQRFSMGRVVKTRQALPGGSERVLSAPMKMLILADPKKDLKGAYAEGVKIRDFMDQNSTLINAGLRSDNITVNSVKEKIRNFDLVHFAGHADYNIHEPKKGGWRLSNGILNIGDIGKMAGTGQMPSLIFSNSCQSARTEEWIIKDDFQNDIFGQANAFLLAGVKHFLGTFWEIQDEAGFRFALEFYRFMLFGVAVGDAMLLARKKLIETFGEETIIWASYVLYGDPTFNYMDQMNIAPEQTTMAASLSLGSDAQDRVRTRDKVVVSHTEKSNERPGFRWAVAIAAVILPVLIIYFGNPIQLDNIGEYEKTALASYMAGDFPETAKTCRLIQERAPGHALASLLLGNISFVKGDTQTAEHHFKQAISWDKGKDSEKADAFMGLGRIASVKRNTSQALKYYQQAAELRPENKDAYVSQAMLLDQAGEHEKALPLLLKAQTLSPDDPDIDVAVFETKEKLAEKKDREKQARIDALAKELIDRYRTQPPEKPSDSWTSKPLSAWMMDFKSLGYSLKEGKERLITFGIANQLAQKSRVKIVERGLLDKLMSELKLGSSNLTDQGVALSLGKMMAARVLLTGQIINDENQVQVLIRLIDTETSQVKAGVSEIFNASTSAHAISEKMSELLSDSIGSVYSLQARVHKIDANRIILNIGQKHGVKTGLKFKEKERDVIIEVVSVDEDQCTAKVVKGEGELQPDLLFLAL